MQELTKINWKVRTLNKEGKISEQIITATSFYDAVLASVKTLVIDKQECIIGINIDGLTFNEEREKTNGEIIGN